MVPKYHCGEFGWVLGRSPVFLGEGSPWCLSKDENFCAATRQRCPFPCPTTAPGKAVPGAHLAPALPSTWVWGICAVPGCRKSWCHVLMSSPPYLPVQRGRWHFPPRTLRGSLRLILFFSGCSFNLNEACFSLCCRNTLYLFLLHATASQRRYFCLLLFGGFVYERAGEDAVAKIKKPVTADGTDKKNSRFRGNCTG